MFNLERKVTELTDLLKFTQEKNTEKEQLLNFELNKKDQ